MSRSLFLAITSLTCIAAFSSIGCDGARTSGPSVNPQKDALVDLGQMLKQLADEKKKPPARLAELEPVEPMIPNAGAAIRTGSIVYLWGASYISGGTKIVAYEKKAPESGGMVLLEDASVKEMTADAFKSAPKAGKS